jgi:hypothetical protein
MRSIKTASKMHGEADGERQFSAADVMNRSGKLLARLVDLFESAEAVDEEVSRVKPSAPSGEHRRLLGGQLTARGLGSFSTADPPIAKGVQLPDWAHKRSDGLAAAPAVRPGLVRAAVVRPPLVGRLVAGTRGRPCHAGVTGARRCGAGGQSVHKPSRSARRTRGIGLPRIPKLAAKHTA